jgi:hypothetical protein
METFICIGDSAAQIGISDLTAVHCQAIAALVQHPVLQATHQRDVRGHYQAALQHAIRAQVTIMPELNHRVGPIESELHFPELTLQDISFAPSDHTQIKFRRQFAQDGVPSWKHCTLVQLTYLDRLYQSSDSDLANPRRILALTIERCGRILGAASTPNHDRAFLLALYAATIRLEAEMRQGHPRFVASIPGSAVMNYQRQRAYASALDFLKVHNENLLRVYVDRKS